MEQKFRFPKDLYADVRIEESYSLWLTIKNGDIENDGEFSEVGAMIRVYDGKLWYTATTNDLGEIQGELDALAALATPNPGIFEDPEIKALEVNRDERMRYEGETDIRRIPREKWKELLDGYIGKLTADPIPEILIWGVHAGAGHVIKQFYSSKGAATRWDDQNCNLNYYFGITVDGNTLYGGKPYVKKSFEELLGREGEMTEIRERYLHYAKNAVEVVPGDYECILAPIVTAMFTHESFGHKSEADFMLNDKTLRDEWVMGKKVGSEKVSICDVGDIPNHGYLPYDDQGTKTRETWLIRDGVLTGRLHDAKSAVALGEELTGNCRAQDYHCKPIVRMTNTYMQAGTDRLEDMIAGVKDGIYVYEVSNGTGNSTFVMNPTLCYRIRDGKVCEPVRVHMVTGSVFQALYDIDAVGEDYVLFDTYSCGKNGQGVSVSAGGPSIRVKKLGVS